MKSAQMFKDFFNSEKMSGIILIFCTLFSLVLSNSEFGSIYQHFWHLKLLNHNLEFWINDGLMTVFFLLIGLELKREVYVGELSKIKDALLPFFGALGGMVVPAIIYLLFNFGIKTQSGIGIPIATEIAFAIAILSLFGNKVPFSLKIFLTALAVIDDLGAIIVIAIFYTKTILWNNLAIAVAIFILLLALNRLKIRTLQLYIILGILMWYFMLNSGVHTTITGVLLAFTTPFENGDKKYTSYSLQQFLNKPVAFLILPLFALANTTIIINSNILEVFLQNYSLGIAFGLIIGKPIGIFLFTFLAVTFGFCKLPNDVNWKSILGVGLLGGIGFTMSIFITLLAFDNQNTINNAKFIILCSSFIAGVLGFFVIKNTKKVKYS